MTGREQSGGFPVAGLFPCFITGIMKKHIGVILAALVLMTVGAALADGFWICSACGQHVSSALGQVCPYCGARHDHDWQPADCTEPERCACGETRGCALGHDWRAATCTAPRTCARCGLAEGKPAGHDWDDGSVSVPATCVTTGVLRYTCRACGKTRRDTLPADPDRHPGDQEIRGQRDAGCLTDGYTGDIYCAACGRLIANGSVLSARGHDWQAATCTAPRTCAACGATDGLPAEHAWDAGQILYPATCAGEGAVRYTCEACGETRTEPLPPDPQRHTGGTEVLHRREPDCETGGYSGDTCCAACGRVIEAGSALPARGHDWQAATCTRPRTCAVCGRTEGEPTGHLWEVAILRPSTCAAEGVQRNTCVLCGLTADEPLPLDPDRHTGRTGIRGAREPGCETEGYTGDTYCSDCGQRVEAGKPIPAAGHQWREETLRPATCASPGLRRRTCGRCGAVLDEAIPADPARHAGGNELRGRRDAGCETDCYTGDTYCAGCGKLLVSGSAVPAPGHDWQAATLTAPKTCRVCGRTEGDPLPSVTRETRFFGHYEQDNNPGNGPEPIEWLVLDARGGQALLISRCGLDVQPYYNDWVETTWEKCTLRRWLNSDFLKAAFSAGEQQAILTTSLSAAEGYAGWSTAGGGSTKDRIFLLSDREAFTLYFAGDAERVCTATPAAIARGAKTDAEGRCWWWLRSPGLQQDNAAYVGADGTRNSHFVLNTTICVRPALRVDLSAID